MNMHVDMRRMSTVFYDGCAINLIFLLLFVLSFVVLHRFPREDGHKMLGPWCHIKTNRMREKADKKLFSISFSPSFKIF